MRKDSMPDLLILDGNIVQQLLTMPLCMEAMQAAAIAVSNKSITVPPRQSMPLNDNSGTLLLMPGSTVDPNVYGVKIINLHPQNTQVGLPVIQGFISLFDHKTGAPVAIIHGATLTAIRTAAASGMATKLLARSDVRSHGIFGTGVQARTHALAILAACPTIEETIIWGRNDATAQALVNTLRNEFNIPACIASDKQEAAACDVVTTVTGSNTPVVLGEWLKPGAHLNVVGAHTPDAREVNTNAVLRSSVYVETIEAAFKEAGELMIPEHEGVFSRTDVVGEIGDVLRDTDQGRQDASQITLYKSLGNAAQDLHAAWVVYQQALAKKAGVSVAF